jgi:energy-coupling factor transporter ATP-binding protein EcfA2
MEQRLALLEAIRDLHDEVERLVLPLDVPGAEQMRQERRAVLGMLASHLVGRIEHHERPLLVVIGGPTGAGKSTLLNSLVGADVSPAGVLRPTTRTPVLLHNPADADRLPHADLVPSGHPADGPDPALADDTLPISVRQVTLLPHHEVPPGLTILDSPDLDSWLDTNRELAVRLLGVADLWLFVTTGTDYADAVPWSLLDDAVRRKVSIATVLNRMRPTEIQLVRRHFAEMLIERGLGSSPVFTVPEMALLDGRIPYDHVRQLHSWLSAQSGRDDLRTGYLDRAVEGTLEQVIIGVRRLVDAAADQVVADWRLRVDLRAIFSLAREEVTTPGPRPAVSDALSDAWKVSWSAVPDSAGSRFRRRLQATLRPPDQPLADVEAALHAETRDLITERLTTPLHRVSERWNNHPAAASLGLDEVPRATSDLNDHIANAVTVWLDGVQLLGPPDDRGPHGRRWSATALALGTLAVSLWSQLPTAPPAGVVEALGGLSADERESAVRQASERLSSTLRALLADQESQLSGMLDSAAVSPLAGSNLRTRLESLERLRDGDPEEPTAR